MWPSPASSMSHALAQRSGRGHVHDVLAWHGMASVVCACVCARLAGWRTSCLHTHARPRSSTQNPSSPAAPCLPRCSNSLDLTSLKRLGLRRPDGKDLKAGDVEVINQTLSTFCVSADKEVAEHHLPTRGQKGGQ